MGPSRPFHVPKRAAATGLGAHKGPRHALGLQQAVTVKKGLQLDSLVCLSPWLVPVLMFLIALLHSSSETLMLSQNTKTYQTLQNI